MHVEVDQSGKIGKTNEDTVLAFSNGINFTILIPRKVKQECLRRLRVQGLEPQSIYMRMFAVGLYFLLREYTAKFQVILIDTEYPGRDAQIKEHLFNLFQRTNVGINKQQITFGFIGKASNAHTIAIATFRGKRRADRVLTVEEIMKHF